MEEFKYKINQMKSTENLILIILCISLFISGLFLKLLYDKIVRRKSEYLQVFFAIKEEECKNALNKCEKFSKLINHMNDDNEDDENNEIENDKKNVKKKKKENNETQDDNEMLEQISKKRAMAASKGNKPLIQNLSFLLSILLLYILVFIYHFGIIFGFRSSLKSMKTYSDLYNQTAFESHIYLSLFDNIREYFYNNSFPYGDDMNIKTKIEQDLINIYTYQKESEQNFDSSLLPSSYKSFFNALQTHELCYYAGDLFTNSSNNNSLYSIDCNDFTNHQGKYGLNLLLTYFTEQIRKNKYVFDSLNISTDSLYQMVNSEDILILSVIRRYLLKPIFEKSLNKFNTSVEKYWSLLYTIFLIMMIVILISYILFYSIYWIPYINKLDESIYKTKNLLSIIPKTVLAAMKNINKILNLGSSIRYVSKKEDEEEDEN